jgi:hypothetical protein
MTTPAFREARLTRCRRQGMTAARALRAGIAARSSLEPVVAIDGTALAALLREAGARDVRALELKAGRPPWTSTGMRAGPGEEVTWMVRGRASLGVARFDAPSTFALRIGEGPIHSTPAESGAAVAGTAGDVRVTNLFPGEPLEDGSVALDRTPFWLRVARGAPRAPRRTASPVAVRSGRSPARACALRRTVPHESVEIRYERESS